MCVASLSAGAQTLLPKDAAVREGKLQNGLTYYIRHNAQTPGQADFYLAQRVGSILEEPEQRGLAHFLEHMAFNGSEHFPDGNGGQHSIRQWCEKNGIKFGADLNASTSVERTIYNIANAPVSKAGITDTCLLILNDWSHALLLRDEEIDQERGVIHEEWRTRRAGRAVQRMMEDAMPVVYQGTKYADCMPIGRMDIVDNFEYEALRSYYRRWYRPDLQAVIVVGDINVDDMEKKITSLFGKIPAPAADAPERVYYPVNDNNEMIVFTEADSEQPTINFSLFFKRDAGKREERATREAFVEGYKSRLAMFILRQRLSQLSKAEVPDVMSCSCRDGQFYLTDEKDAFTLTIGLLPEKPQAGIDAAMAIVQKAARYGFTESELEHAKMQYNVNLEHRIDNRNNQRNGEYISKIVNHFCNGEQLMAIEDEADLEHSLMETVTLADVNKTMAEMVYLNAQHSASNASSFNQVCIVYGPTKWNNQPYVMPTESQLKQWIMQAEQREYADDNVNTTVDRTFISKLPKKGKILSKSEGKHGYKVYHLSNGITVYARPSELEPNRLTLSMFRSGGQSLYGDDDVPSMKLLSSVITQSGAADFDYLTLEKKRAGKALRVTPFIDSETEGVKGVCAASDFKTWLEVAYLYLTQPRRDEKIFKNMIAKQQSLLKNRLASPQVTYNDSLRMTIYGKSERTEPMTAERLDKVSLDRIFDIYRERFSNLAGMNFIVTGDIRMDEFEDMLTQYVASLPGKPQKNAAAPKVGPYCLDTPQGKRDCIFHMEQKTPSALTNVIYTVKTQQEGTLYTADNELKADILGQIMRAIYTEKVREEKGGTYGVSVSTQGWRYPSDGLSMTINFRCDPDKYAELLPIIDEQLQLMAKNGPTQAQLDKVKEYEQKNYERVILTNNYWEYVMQHELEEGIDYDHDYMARVNSFTTDDIRDICRLILSQGNRVQVTMK